MPVYQSDGPGVDTKGSSNTECLVLIHTHDRGKDNPSQAIDLSPYLTQVTCSQHLIGGGTASIDVPAIDHIEDIIAAGDIVNIYFNTNRSNENLYNRGRVRTFFGYVLSVAKSISVGGEGAKLTTYSIFCKDFSKCVRDTQIYNNEHLASQSFGGKENVVRADLGTNLAGIALLHRGIALQGTPRQIVIQNLMRFLGFGGQWALPLSYDEQLPGESSWKFEAVEGKHTIISSLQAVTMGVLSHIDNTDGALREKYIKAIVALSKAAVNKKKPISHLWDNVPTDLDPGIQAIIKKLKDKFKNLKYKLKGTTGRRSHINNTFFEIEGTDQKKMHTGIGSIAPTDKVTKDEQGLWKDIEAVTARVINEIEGVSKKTLRDGVDSFPKANQYAQPFDYPTHNDPVKTIFNILCLDYMESTKGYWANLSMMNYTGSLYTSLGVGANLSMNELIFDLRPTPKFRAAEKDGLGIPLMGAMPMVPAVVLRRKPFTNYKVPGSVLKDAQVGKHLVVGGYETNAASAGFDQLVINSGGAMGVGAATPVDGTMGVEKIKLILKNSGVNKSLIGLVQKTELKSVIPPTKKKKTKILVKDKTELAAWAKKVAELGEKAEKTGVNSNKDLVALFKKATSIGGGETVTAGFQLGKGTSESPILAKAALTSVVTLPRPIFRSPDGNRILKELDLSRTQYIFGVLSREKGKDLSSSKFFAFEAAGDAGVPYETHTVKPGTIRNYTGHLLTASTPSKHTTKRVALDSRSSMGSIGKIFTNKAKQLKKDELDEVNDMDWHVLDYMTLNPQDISGESYTRGDFGVVNFLEYFGKTLGGSEAQRLFLGVVMPIVTPISVYRFGVRVMSQTTDHVQALLTGNSEHLFEKNILLRWAILQDVWNQHNHELLAGSMSLRGMPGLRPGYRVDRPDINMSFYVEQVSHTWQYPGRLETQISVSHGQPMNKDSALDYYRPSPLEPAYKSERQNLGKIFKVSKFKQGGADITMPSPGTFTGKKYVGGQLDIKTRKNKPNESKPLKPKDKS